MLYHLYMLVYDLISGSRYCISVGSDYRESQCCGPCFIGIFVVFILKPEYSHAAELRGNGEIVIRTLLLLSQSSHDTWSENKNCATET